MSVPSPVPRPPTPGINPVPIQSYQFSKEQLADPAVMNVFFQQVADALNLGNGTLGKVVQPSGFDVRGATVSNLGAPEEDGDAISAGHAASQYSPEAQQKALDIGGPNALKGLNAAYAQSAQNAQAISRINASVANAATVLASGGTTPLAGPIIQMGDTAAIPTTLPVVFPTPFPNTVPIVVACDDYAGGADSIISVEKASVTKAGFTLHSNNTSSGAFWIAIGS
jgi:hypothetical protein